MLCEAQPLSRKVRNTDGYIMYVETSQIHIETLYSKTLSPITMTITNAPYHHVDCLDIMYCMYENHHPE